MVEKKSHISVLNQKNQDNRPYVILLNQNQIISDIPFVKLVGGPTYQVNTLSFYIFSSTLPIISLRHPKDLENLQVKKENMI